MEFPPTCNIKPAEQFEVMTAPAEADLTMKQLSSAPVIPLRSEKMLNGREIFSLRSGNGCFSLRFAFSENTNFIRNETIKCEKSETKCYEAKNASPKTNKSNKEKTILLYCCKSKHGFYDRVEPLKG
jgi:hypothetical protein